MTARGKADAILKDLQERHGVDISKVKVGRPWGQLACNIFFLNLLAV
jgi:hypothetical protein